LILGIAGIVIMPLIPSIIAVVLGRRGQRAADAGLASNRSSATAGLILGWVGIAFAVLGTILIAVIMVWVLPQVPTLDPYGDVFTFSEL
jgi:hypothetical protein